MRSGATPAGRSSKNGDKTCLTPTIRPVLTSTRMFVPHAHLATAACHNSRRMSSGNSDWVTRDLAHVWHPCTQMKDHESVPMIPLRSGNGVWLEDFSGKRYLDGISSWWVNLFGHANERINAALREQLEKLEHAIFAGFTH